MIAAGGGLRADWRFPVEVVEGSNPFDLTSKLRAFGATHFFDMKDLANG